MPENYLNHLRRWGPVYWHPFFHRLTMTLLRPRRRKVVFPLLAAEIGNRSVLDLCCGEAELKRWLPKNRYSGIEANSLFAAAAGADGSRIVQGDVLEVAWPEAECIVMMDSLYHFLPDRVERLLEKIAAHPARKAILCEAVDNMASSRYAWVRRCSDWATRTDGRSHPHRFTDASLRAHLAPFGFNRWQTVEGYVIGVRDA